MTHRKPIEFLEAIAVAAPLCEPLAFRNAISSIGTRDSCRGATSSALAEACVRRMRDHSRGRSLSELELIRDRVWFAAEEARPQSRSAIAPLEDYAAELLETCADGRANVRPSWRESIAARVQRYRWLTLLVPWEFVVLAARQREPDSEGPLSRPDLLATFGPKPDGAWSNRHVHLGGAAEFVWLWTGMMTDAYRGRLRLDALPDDPAIPGDGTRSGLRDLLAGAAVIRLLLARLARGETYAAIQSRFGPEDRRLFCTLVGEWAHGKSASSSAFGAALGPATKLLHHRFQALLPLGWSPQIRQDDRSSIDGLHRLDPVGPLMGATDANSPEHCLLSAAWRMARTSHGSLAARLALAYVRCWAWLYRFVVQQPGVSGLAWFSRHYRRIDALAAPLTDARYDCAERIESTHLELRSLELRTTPNSLASKLAAVARHRRPRAGAAPANVRRGLVLHLLRTESHTPDWHLKWATRAVVDAQRIDEACAWGRPDALWGVDAANDELGVQPWIENVVMARAFRHAAPGRARSSCLGLTIHAGEDYRTLHEGLRRIDQAMDLAERLGDCVAGSFRIGHGLAALSSDGFAEHSAVQPRFARLLDIWWELRLSAIGRTASTSARQAHLMGEVAQLALDLGWMGGIVSVSASDPAEAALRIVDHLHDPRRVEPHLRGVDRGRIAQADPVAQLLDDASLARRATQTVCVHVDGPEREAALSLRSAVRERARRSGVVFEACPSSNLVVGDHNSLGMHPMHSVTGLRVILADDDPLTFATCLADERAYALAGAMLSGKTRDEALDWLEGLRQTGELLERAVPP